MQPIINPASPGTYAFQRPVVSGLEIVITGQVKHNKKDFAINLLSGGNIALHTNFRWEKTKKVAINSQIGNVWGSELSHDNPLHHDSSFELQIRVYPGYFHITTNGVLLADFPHRIPFETIQAISFEGHVNINSVNFNYFH